MISASQSETMVRSLRMYDVVDGGWVHESKGLDFNLRHVSIELADMSDRKDFTDPDQVQREIAPDLVQYGLRIARWAAVHPDSLVISDGEEADEHVRKQSRKYTGSDAFEDFFAVSAAMGILARDRHPVDHGDKVAGSLDRDNLGRAAHMLLWAANNQATCGDFDIVEALDERLAGLRVRFDVPRRTES